MSMLRTLDRIFVSPLGAVLYCAAVWGLFIAAACWVLL